MQHDPDRGSRKESLKPAPWEFTVILVAFILMITVGYFIAVGHSSENRAVGSSSIDLVPAGLSRADT